MRIHGLKNDNTAILELGLGIHQNDHSIRSLLAVCDSSHVPISYPINTYLQSVQQYRKDG